MIFKMNCSRIQALLPLYTEGDLPHDARRERAVAVHLRTCHDCARRAAEFSRSQNLLRAAALTPSFDAAFFNEIRSAVRAQIEARESVAPSFAAGIFRRKLALTTAFVLLLAAGSFAIYMRLDRTLKSTGALDSASVRQDVLHQNDLPETSRAEQHDVNEPSTPRAATVRSEAYSLQRTRARTRFIHRRRMQPSVRAASITRMETHLAAAAPPVRIEGTNETIDPETNDAAHDDVAQAMAGGASEFGDQTLRIELQTSDPTIRIIWLSPRINEQPTATPMN